MGKATAKTKSSLAVVDEHTEAMAVLGEVFGADEYSSDMDGLGETEKGDVKLPVLVFNSKGENADTGKLAQHDQLWNTVTGEVLDSVQVVLVSRVRRNLYAYYDNDKQETVRVCASDDDRVTGTLFEGESTRPCKGCRHTEWVKDAKGKNVRDCCEVWTFLALRVETMEPVLLKFKKTSMPAIKTHLQRFHIGKLRTVNPKAKPGSHLPPYAYVVEVSGEMDTSGNYAKPKIEVVSPTPGAVVRDIVQGYEGMADLLTRNRETGDDAGDESSTEGATNADSNAVGGFAA